MIPAGVAPGPGGGASRGGALSATPKVVGLVVHGGRPGALAAAHRAAALLAEHGVAVVGCDDDGWVQGEDDGVSTSEAAATANELPVELRHPSVFSTDLDLVLAFGGDGTFLRAAYRARDSGVPLLGINLGRLGFLQEVEEDALPTALERLMAGSYGVEERMTLTADVVDADGQVLASSWALNEVSIERAVPQRLIVLQVSVGDVVFAHIPADAVICATPTGSTAYAFSAGGPILSPLVDAILLVPVAAHSLFNRTLVVDPRERLTVTPVDSDNPCVVSCDGRPTLQVPEGGRVHVRRGDVPVRFARLGTFDFYRRVRDKFGLR